MFPNNAKYRDGRNERQRGHFSILKSAGGKLRVRTDGIISMG